MFIDVFDDLVFLFLIFFVVLVVNCVLWFLFLLVCLCLVIKMDEYEYIMFNY